MFMDFRLSDNTPIRSYSPVRQTTKRQVDNQTSDKYLMSRNHTHARQVPKYQVSTQLSDKHSSTRQIPKTPKCSRYHNAPNYHQKTQYNATYEFIGSEQKIVIFEEDYDYENDIENNTIIHEVSLEDAMNEGVTIQVLNSYDEDVNCTINYTDVDSDASISPGDTVSITCEESVMNGYKIGIADGNGIAHQVDMQVPWISPIFTIIALLGAAVLVSRRD